MRYEAESMLSWLEAEPRRSGVSLDCLGFELALR